jgi:hypothetical protein
MKQLKSALNVQPSIPQQQTAIDSAIETTLKIRSKIIDAIIKRNRF